jgi:hypothetical protein
MRKSTLAQWCAVWLLAADFPSCISLGVNGAAAATRAIEPAAYAPAPARAQREHGSFAEIQYPGAGTFP